MNQLRSVGGSNSKRDAKFRFTDSLALASAPPALRFQGN